LSIDLKATEVSPTHYEFSGDNNLGWLAGGNYHYEGSADVTGDRQTDLFTCTYKSSADHGRFNMTRPPAAGVATDSP
jgi:hypothetical protein